MLPYNQGMQYLIRWIIKTQWQRYLKGLLYGQFTCFCDIKPLKEF